MVQYRIKEVETDEEGNFKYKITLVGTDGKDISTVTGDDTYLDTLRGALLYINLLTEQNNNIDSSRDVIVDVAGILKVKVLDIKNI